MKPVNFSPKHPPKPFKPIASATACLHWWPGVPGQKVVWQLAVELLATGWIELKETTGGEFRVYRASIRLL